MKTMILKKVVNTKPDKVDAFFTYAHTNMNYQWENMVCYHRCECMYKTIVINSTEEMSKFWNRGNFKNATEFLEA